MTENKYLTPNAPPAGKFWKRELLIPADPTIGALVSGALLSLCYSTSFEQYGELTPDETADLFSTMFQEYQNNKQDRPFWEDDEDVGDDGLPAAPWYDDVADWIIEAFLAITGFPQAAIIYSTTVPKVRIAIKTGNFGALFKILLNNLEIYTGDSYAPIDGLFGATLDLAGFAADNGLGAGPWALKIVHDGAGPNLPAGNDGTLSIVRKRLSDEIPMIFRQTDPCLVEYSDNDGSSWHTVADLSLCSGATSPIGTMLPFAGATVPTGWLSCDGAAVSRSTYAALFAVIGETWGDGDGSTTFNLPDIRGRTVVGAGQGSGLTNRVLGTSGGEETHQLTVSEMPGHNHGIYPADTSGSHYYAQLAGSNGGEENINVTTYSRGGGNAHNTMQPWLSAIYIIKY